ncbi:MAG TPA: adenosine deaminase [Calditrichia bacterium]|nr:adenosine deaminase [Calditrichota bacterium]HQU71629.1 adenosine deaminase [Calditrichia bacterium]HQV30580.1 adenosine deaminase [Calditrichia bacterium]
MEPDFSLIKALPKTDLHIHLDGSLRVSTLIDLARRQKVDLPSFSPETLAPIVMSGKNCRNLGEYLRGFDITLSVMQEPEALRRIAFELAEDAAEENVWYMEVRYSPILHLQKGLALETIVDAVLEGLREAEQKYPIRTGVIICGMRNIHPDKSLQLAELAIKYKNRGVVAFDLAGQEENNPAKHHKEAFYQIRNNNINTTIHAGEAYGPESIHQAIHYCGANRIGHGTRLREDEDLKNYVNDHRIPLEVCLLSNVQTGAAASLDTHPAREYLREGIRITLNTDNRLISDTTMSNEIYLAMKHLDFNMADIIKILTNGFKSVFLPYKERAALLKKATAALEKFA